MKELILISCLGVLALIAGLFNLRKLMMPIVIASLVLNIIFCVYDWNANESVYNMLLLDNFALAFTIVISFVSILWFLSSSAYFNNDNNFSDHYALVLFSLCGGFIMVSFSNMVMLFLGLEILSIPLFVLVGSNKTRPESNEAAFKYFILGAFASAFLLFGITLIYGVTGSFNTVEISKSLVENNMPPMAFAGMLMMMAAMAFKVSAVPFHFWAPDVYQGAPAMITAFMATVVKTVAFAGFFRLFSSSFLHLEKSYSIAFAVMAASTLLIANITASVQGNVKRMLAYSSISHAGFMMITLLCMQSKTEGILLYYTLVYSLSSIIAFTILKLVKNNSGNDDSLAAFSGLLRRNRFITAVMAFSLLSMSGIPPFAGFMAKYLVFVAAVENGYMWLTVVAIIASLIAVYYYFKVIITMFNGETTASAINIPLQQKIVFVICTLGLLLMSIMPQWILDCLG